jgi:MFS transporter, ACS family, D-galactonate transporter
MAVATGMTAAQWRLVALLVFSVYINYIDRGSLSVAGKAIQDELGLSNTMMGLLFTAFFWTYAAGQLLAGWLVDRYPVAMVLGISYLVWSIATAATGLCNTFAAIFAVRLVLGIGEAAAYPSYSKMFAADFSEAQRGKANSLIDAGSKVGPAMGLVGGGLMVMAVGWRVGFLVLGLGSLVWLIPWFRWAPKMKPVSNVAGSDDYVPGWLEILSKRSAWGSFFGLFGANFAWYFLLTWLPLYFVRERHFSQETMSIVGSLPYWGIAISTTFGGWLSDRLIARGASTTSIRKGFVIGGLTGTTIMLPAAMAHETWLCITLLCTACLSFGMFSSNHWALTQCMAGKGAAGRWTGLQNGFGNLAGITAPWIAGVIRDATGSLLWAFASCAVMLLVGASSYLFIVGRIEPMKWRHQSESS